MLISFSVENWMSFRDPVTFTMVASRERQHGERVPRVRKYQTRVLPIAAIYGGNASGKSNFFKALNFVRTLVVRGTHPNGLIPVEPFALDAASAEQPSHFGLELLVGDTMYEYRFSVTRETVVEEKLVAISSTSERVLYHRRDGRPNFHASLANHQFLQFVFQGTRNNQLLLTNAVSQNVHEFRPVYDWFREHLVLIAPDSRFQDFEKFLDEEHPLYASMNEMLGQLDTGIAHLGGEEIELGSIALPGPVMSMLQEEVKEGTSLRLFGEPTNQRIVVTRKKGRLVAKRLVAYHRRSDGMEVQFEMSRESDGSQRVIDLLPAFLDLSTSESTKVYVVDEIDRSLHPLLTRKLLEFYLSSCTTDTRSQMLFTTHDVLLMDQNLLRRDEMWVAERDDFGASTLIPFSAYRDIRYDKDVRKSYLQGRLGGIPRIVLGAMS